MNKKKIILYSLGTVLFCGFLYLYIWEKPKLERFLLMQIIEPEINSQISPNKIKIDKLNISFIPLQVELYNVNIKPAGEIRSYLTDFSIKKIIGRPSLIDIIVGKPWLSLLQIEGSEIDIKIPEVKQAKNKPKSSTDFNLNKILRQIPISQLGLQDLVFNINYADKWFVSTESLYIKAFNEKSSLILTIKDPNIGIKNGAKKDPLNFLADFQVMITSNTISISSIKIVKDNSFFVASGNIIYEDSPEKYEELNIKSRIRSNFDDINKWINQIQENHDLDILKGSFKADIQLTKEDKNKELKASAKAEVSQLQVDKIKIGDIAVEANAPNKDQINIPLLQARLAGDNPIKITDAKVHLGKRTEIKADVSLENAQLHSFLRDSGIADIPVWLRVGGNLNCNGFYEKTLKIDCPGALTVKNLKIQNGGRQKSIVESKKIDIAGQMTITEKAISYKAKAKMKKTEGASTGKISFKDGFDIQYESPYLDLSEIGPIADLKFLGVGSTKGSTKGSSRTATFEMDIKMSDFEFEEYFFGEITTKLNYKTGTLYFKEIAGNLESTRYKGNLDVNLLKEQITGDIVMPFFRMTDVQQAIFKKVDLQNRFTGSGSGRVIIDTPFDVGRMGFQLDARLFKGKAFGEEYNEAKIKAEAVEGVIIFQQARLEKEKTLFLMKGTLDADLKSNLQFTVESGFLQLSTILKKNKLPVSGEFSANGQILGNLGNPIIKTKAEIKNLNFNKKKYGDGLFSYDNSNKQTNLQFSLPEQLEFLLILPESNFESLFLDINANKFDIAPLVGYSVSEDSTRSYVIETSGEISGKVDTKDLWNSEFSSTIKKIKLNYKANVLETKIPANIEMKNHRVFLNEIDMAGNKQFVKITQPFTEKYNTKFVINSRLNIAFFKLFAPFFEKIDGYSTLRLELGIANKKLKLVGSSYTTNGYIKFPGFPHPFENMTADILFNQNKARINSLSGTMADGKVLGTGEVNFPAPGKFDLLITTNIEEAKISFPEGFNSWGSGSITLSGNKAPFLLSGDYNVTGGLIESNFSSSGGGNSSDLLEELLKKEITSPLVLNLDITTEKPVEVRNSLVEGYILGDMKVYDKINAPRIKGEVHFDDDSVVKFKDQEFEVTSSSFLFEGQNPINPKLTLRSKTRLNSYDIDLFLSGRAANPILTMTSQPPLPETQIISMLAFGQLPDQFDQTGLNNPNTNNSIDNNQNQNNGFEVGTSLIGNNPLAREIKEQSGFDVQISSSFDETTGAAAPRFTLRNKVSKKLEVSASSTTGNANQYEGRVTYELRNNLSTIFRVSSPENQGTNNNTTNNTTTNRNNRVGVDLEYNLEFD